MVEPDLAWWSGRFTGEVIDILDTHTQAQIHAECILSGYDKCISYSK